MRSAAQRRGSRDRIRHGEISSRAAALRRDGAAAGAPKGRWPASAKWWPQSHRRCAAWRPPRPRPSSPRSVARPCRPLRSGRWAGEGRGAAGRGPRGECISRTRSRSHWGVPRGWGAGRPDRAARTHLPGPGGACSSPWAPSCGGGEAASPGGRSPRRLDGSAWEKPLPDPAELAAEAGSRVVAKDPHDARPRATKATRANRVRRSDARWLPCANARRTPAGEDSAPGLRARIGNLSPKRGARGKRETASL